VHEADHFRGSPGFISQDSNADTIPVNRAFRIPARRSPHGHAVRHGFAEEGYEINGNPFAGEDETGAGEITILFPGCREPFGNGFDGGWLLVVQIAHASLPVRPMAVS
jgi:hypothetical protein